MTRRREDKGGARRLVLDPNDPAPTVMAVGIGSVNPYQYRIDTSKPVSIKSSDSKPPYRVPTMEEIRELPWNGYHVVSTFSGAGGSSTGYRMAGFRVLWASEFIDEARKTYAANKAPYTIVDGRDIRQVTGGAILKDIGLKPGELDLLDGSPPCASFSTAGKREAGWGKVKAYSDKAQRTDDLFFEYTRLLRYLQPRTFVAENVSGLIKGTAKGYFKRILAELKGCGYRVQCQLLDAQWLGVPQARQRTIFIGVREDLGINPVFPRPLRYRYSIAEALPWLGSADGSGPAGGDPPPPDISRYAIGKEYDKLKPGEQSGRYFNLVRVSQHKPSPTVCASHGQPGIASIVHPTEKRKFTIAELKRICGFPDDFVLTGTYAQQWERLGRAVPPVMMSHIANAVLEVLHEADAR